MSIDRRKFLKIASATGAAAVSSMSRKAEASEKKEPGENSAGCLVDTVLCIGCRQCENACNRSNDRPKPGVPFTDKSVFREERRHTPYSLTVVNEYPGSPSSDTPERKNTYVKYQCMHCVDPACVSACIVGALTKTRDGAVVYNATLCIGCRYCMFACPFQVPAYEYWDTLTPRVYKCEFCVDREKGTGADPACAAACPVEAIVFGKRKDLLKMAKDRIKDRPDRYEDHIYGEHEVGGTSWIYLRGRPRKEIGLLELPEKAPPRLTESIQHGIFKYGAIPIAVYGVLGGLMWYNHRKHGVREDENEHQRGGE